MRIDSEAGTNCLLLECRDLRKTFVVKRQEICVLESITFSVNRGEIVVLTGKSGAGKSTLLGILAGLDRPTSGSAIFEGRPLESMTNEALAWLRRRDIGIVFQSFNLLPSWTAFENVEAALMHTGLSKSARRQKVVALLEALGLGARLDNLPAELSVGEQQRVAVARTLIHAPKLLLADEPTGDVDPETAQEIIARLVAPVKETGATLIVATHGIFPQEIADTVFQMKDGRLAPATE
ncbi:MAG: ABC transporter ATP-binding protein [Armatimonadetes bacterium]|nr:ABC transporter ATP-binding protein [Armatimonadota bacterium]